MGSSHLAIPPSSSTSSSSGEGSGAADQGDSDLSGEEGSEVVASTAQVEDRMPPDPTAKSSGLPSVQEGQLGRTAQDGSSVRLPHQREGAVVQGGHPDALDEEDQDFLLNHIRPKTRKVY